MVEYEALLIGLKSTKDMNISEIFVFGDAELIIQQIRNFYQTKHPRLRDCQNAVWIIMEDSFLAFN
ncbi:reverse transcriptase-like protein, partial [Bacteroides uniformis]|uniref:reverse transcriptase-like protein n=1 Tax=Bacteroides uniformis TaxID=820 RepID=UPI00293D2D4F